jgi:hypothetical protein
LHFQIAHFDPPGGFAEKLPSHQPNVKEAQRAVVRKVEKNSESH